MTGIPVLLALEGAAHEQVLLAGLQRPGSGVLVVRRCVDVADLLAGAASGLAAVAIVDSGFRRLDHDLVQQLRVCGLMVVGVAQPDEEAAERRLRMIGVDDVVVVDPEDGHGAAEAIAAHVRGGARVPAPAAPPDLERVPPPDRAGRLVAVWGPTGAPGRSTLATYLACETAALGVPTMLADADTYGGSVAQLLGLLDESPGLAAAARAVSGGTFDTATLDRSARTVGPNLRVLTGIVRADRWPELRPAALTEVWSRSRVTSDLTIVDCGFSLEEDEELTYDTRAPRRNGATLATLSAADVVIAVGRADPVGVQRLVRLLPDARALAGDAEVRVLLTRVRKGPVGRDAEGQLTESLARHAGVVDPVLVREDQDAYDAALSAGRALHEVAPRSAARLAIHALARELAAPVLPQPGRRRRGRLREPAGSRS